MTRNEFLAIVKQRYDIDPLGQMVMSPVGFSELLEIAGVLEPNPPPSVKRDCDANHD